MRVLFLDFDGVLNSHDWWTRRGAFVGNERTLGWEFDPLAVARLNDATRGDVRIVVSSSWRYGRSVDHLRDLLAQVPSCVYEVCVFVQGDLSPMVSR